MAGAGNDVGSLGPLLESAPLAAFVVDASGNVVRWNRAAERLFGWSEQELLGHPVPFVADDRPGDLERLRERALRGESGVEVQVRGRKHNGERVYVRLYAGPAYDDAGRPTSVLMMAADVTEQQRTLETLGVIFDSVPAMIWFKDGNNKILRCNRLAAANRGVSVEQMEGRYTEEFYPEEAARYLADDREVVTSGQAKLGIVEPHQTGSGEKIWVRVDKLPHCDESGRIAGVIVFAVDVTAFKLVEEAQRFLVDLARSLSTSPNYATTLASAARLAASRLGEWCIIDLADEHGRHAPAVAHADGALGPRLGDAVAAHAGGLPALAATLGGRNAQRVPEITDASLDRLGCGRECARLFRALDTRTAILVPISVRGRHGVIVLGSSSPVRRYWPMEVSLVHELGYHVAIALEHAQLLLEAQEAVRARDEFLALASHELKTPLTPLLLRVQRLGRHWTAGSVRTESDVRVLHDVERQVKKVASLVDSLLDVSRITSGQLRLKLEKVDLSELLREVATNFDEYTARARCSLRLHADRPVVGRWDRQRIEEVITSLLSNAIQYAPGLIDLVAEVDGALARLVVHDCGPGITPEDLERIFRRFERAASVRHHGGLGLGLYITRQIVEAHGGSIHATSAPGEGSTFTVELPRSGPP